MSPTPRAAFLVGACALTALVLPWQLAILAMVAVAGAAVADAWSVRAVPELERELATVVSRGYATPVRVHVDGAAAARTRVRQPLPPDVSLDVSEADGGLDSLLVARRRGRHVLAPVAVRVTGPLGLGAWTRAVGEPAELHVYPDMPHAYRLARAVRERRLREVGLRARGPLGLGTEFESVRDYLPDDDFRQINWRATARMQRPMSNTFRVEQEREVLCAVDAGRLMAAPLGDRTRLDAAVDASVAVAAVADVLGDRVGALAFDDGIRARVRPDRRGARAIVGALFDLESSPVESDYELAFRNVGAKRVLVLIFTDLLDEAAAGSLASAVPVLARRHAVIVVSALDPEIQSLVARAPRDLTDAYTAAVAADLLASRRRAATMLRRAGAEVVEAPPDRLSAACVSAYLQAKERGRV
jgi:uncharacterized protein (DUF58 family)